MASLFLAKLIGIIVLVKGIAILSKKKECGSIVGEFVKDKPLMYFVSVLELAAGLAIVLNHNIWSGGWPVIITVIGWLMVIEGVAVSLLSYNKMSKLFKGFTNSGWLNFWAVIAIIFGAYLTYVGFWG